MEDESDIDRDRQRAEVFDALGHPTRITILKALSEGPLGFADLKKKTTIESSGHLQHHLSKLNGLIKTDENGKYCLSEQGKDALLTVQTVEKSSAATKNSEKRLFRLNKLALLKSASILLVALLIASSAIAIYEFNQSASLKEENDFFNKLDPQAAAFYNQFRIIPTAYANSSFEPPISMYQALQIGLKADDWNRTSLQGFTVYISLMYWVTPTTSAGPSISNSTGNYYGSVAINGTWTGDVTSPPANYSDVYDNGVIFRYIWQIDIQKTGHASIPPWDLIIIDASTGEIVPNPMLL